MIVVVDPDLPLPVYEQVREQIARMVAAGTLKPGHQLPTIRQLAADLGLAKGTISKAYELLEADNIIAMNGRKGSFVLDVQPPEQGAQKALESTAEALVVAARQSGAGKSDAIKAIELAWGKF